ncbi:hypothetical protein E5288_WYG019576 [Bos mutus]|uniref:JNK pathway associated phosphatase n=1 Tax=Bos mutus TaxID=72004 RepID=A0A6B0RUZ1_9CETA|nr:hypothetical protein [Bos mutus]
MRDGVEEYSLAENTKMPPLSSVTDARDAEQLSKNKVTHILSVHDSARPMLEGVKYLCIPAADSPSQNLTRHFKESIKFIHECRLQGEGCLVHCLAGVSRSVTLVVAYIMTVTDFGWEDALHTVRAGRSCANPNLGFQRQLQEFEELQVHQLWMPPSSRHPSSGRPQLWTPPALDPPALDAPRLWTPPGSGRPPPPRLWTLPALDAPKLSTPQLWTPPALDTPSSRPSSSGRPPGSGRSQLWTPPALDAPKLSTPPVLDDPQLWMSPGSGRSLLWTPPALDAPKLLTPPALDAPRLWLPPALDARHHHPRLPRGLVCPPRACRGALTTCCLCALAALPADVLRHTCPESWLL